MKNDTSAFLHSVTQTVERHDMDISEPLVMVSGGPDSVALLRAVIALGGSPSVLHVDHGLRAAESAEDSHFVEMLCANLDVACTVRRPYIHPGPGLQERARNERYRLAELERSQTKTSSVALGHNADDVAETALMNLSRGAGSHGLGSIPPVRGILVRPLIDRTREEILAYLGSSGQNYRTDSTNLTNKYTRNRMRYEVLPLLEEMYPGASSNIRRAARLVRDDLYALETIVGGVTEVRVGEIVVVSDGLPGDERARRTLLRHAVRGAFRRLRPEEKMPDAETVDGIAGAIFGAGGSRIFHLPAGVIAAVRSGGEISVYEDREPSDNVEVLLEYGEMEYAGWRVRVEGVSRFDRKDAAREEVAYLVGGEYRVRLAREKDTIRPLGLRGSKTVLRAMMDRKVPKDIRRRTPVVVDGAGEIAWIFCGEIGEKHAIKSTDGEMIRLEVEKV